MGNSLGDSKCLLSLNLMLPRLLRCHFESNISIEYFRSNKTFMEIGKQSILNRLLMIR